MNLKETIIKVRRLIASNDTEKAINALLDFIEDSNGVDEIILQSSKYNRIKRDIRLNILNANDANVLLNKLNYGLLELTKELEGKNLDKLEKIQNSVTELKQYFKTLKKKREIALHDIEQFIHLTINIGAPIYNKSDYKGCATVYCYTSNSIVNIINFFSNPNEYGLTKERMMVEKMVNPNKRIESSIMMNERMSSAKSSNQNFNPIKLQFADLNSWSKENIDSNPNKVSWELRYAFDKVLKYIYIKENISHTHKDKLNLLHNSILELFEINNKSSIKNYSLIYLTQDLVNTLANQIEE